MAMTKDDDDVAVSIYHTCIRFSDLFSSRAWKITALTQIFWDVEVPSCVVV